MTLNLRIDLLIFSILLLLLIFKFMKDKKIPVKYALVWIFASAILLFVSLFPKFLGHIASLIGFEVLVNLVIAILLVLLLYITLVLTIIVSKQQKKITILIQEVSLLKGEQNNDKKS